MRATSAGSRTKNAYEGLPTDDTTPEVEQGIDKEDIQKVKDEEDKSARERAERAFACTKGLYYVALLLLPVLTIGGAYLGSCEAGLPIYLLILPPLLVFAIIVSQVAIALPAQGSGCLPRALALLSIVLGSLEIYDLLSDGQQVAQAVLCDAIYHEAFVDSWKVSKASFLVPVVRTVHLWGMLAATLVVSTLLHAFYFDFLDRRGLDTYAAQWAGFYGFAGVGLVGKGQKDTEESDRLQNTSVKSVICGALEAAPQSLLSSSVFCLSFSRTLPKAKAQQLLGFLLTTKSIIQATCPLFICTYWCGPMAFNSLIRYRENAAAAKAGLSSSQGGTPSWSNLCRRLCAMGSLCCAVVNLITFLISMVLFVVYFLALVILVLCPVIMWLRIYHAFKCESHVWNVTTGCVPLTEHFMI